MAITTALAIASTALTAVGTGVSLYGQAKETQARQKAEEARQKQQTLAAQRQRRAAIRQSIIARSVAQYNASSQGADFGSSLPGAFGQIGGETGRQIRSINQNEELGTDIFKANRDFYDASSVTSFGSGMDRLAAVTERLGTNGTGQRVFDYLRGSNG